MAKLDEFEIQRFPKLSVDIELFNPFSVDKANSNHHIWFGNKSFFCLWWKP